MEDTQIHERIEQVVAEEHELGQRVAGGGAGAAEQRRLAEVGVALDQCWDLLRQRRALDAAGLDPDAAGERPAGTVENYRQ
jgi:hypothetical protein